MKEYDFGERKAQSRRGELPDRVVAVAAGYQGGYLRYNRLMIALWISTAALGGGAAGRPGVGGDAPIEHALPRRRVPATDGHMAAQQRQKTGRLSRHNQP